MPLLDPHKGLLITATGVAFIVPDALFVRLIGGDPLVTTFWRAFISGLAILAGVLLTQGPQGLRPLRHMGWPGWGYTWAMASSGLAFVMAVAHTSVANTVFILASMPVFAAVFSVWVLGEAIQRRTAVTTGVVLCGLSLVAFGSGQSAVSSWVGDSWALYVAVAHGMGLTLVRKIKAMPLVITVPVAYLGLAAALLLVRDPWPAFGAHPWLYLAHGLCTALATSLLSLGPRYLSSPEVALLFLLESVFSPLLVWAVLGEDPGPWALVGGAVVVSALAISNALVFRARRKSLAGTH
jgi:drug/metabolite transporter (DMT)-like permease